MSEAVCSAPAKLACNTLHVRCESQLLRLQVTLACLLTFNKWVQLQRTPVLYLPGLIGICTYVRMHCLECEHK